MARALRESEAMVVLLTPDALESDPVRWEIDYALSQKRYNKRLIPVTVGQPEEFSEESIPWILKYLKVINLPRRGEDEQELREIAQALKEVA